VFVPPRYSEAEAREAVAASLSWSEALRRLGMCSTGGGYRVLQKYAAIWAIPTDHFDPWAANRRALARRSAERRVSLDELLVAGRYAKSSSLKERLYDAGLKARRCELCGQGEEWRGRRMSLILDHVNGVRDDNRLENLRIVCPNCNATLDTHCGRNATLLADRECAHCRNRFRPKSGRQRYCSRACGSRWDRRGGPRPSLRRVERPPFEQLRAEIVQLGYVGVGRRYGVSDNAVRKWVLWYEREAAAAAQAADASASTTRSMRTRPA
jgi:hypothetical protein